MNNENSKYLNDKLQISRACAQEIRNKAMALEDFVRSPSTKSCYRHKAMEQLNTIRLTSSRIIATSDRALSDSVPLDVELLIEQLRQIIECKCSNLNDNEHRNLMVLMSEVWAMLYEHRPANSIELGASFDNLVTLDSVPMEAA